MDTPLLADESLSRHLPDVPGEERLDVFRHQVEEIRHNGRCIVCFDGRPSQVLIYDGSVDDISAPGGQIEAEGLTSVPAGPLALDEISGVRPVQKIRVFSGDSGGSIHKGIWGNPDLRWYLESFMDDIPVNGRPLATIPVLVQGKKNSYQILRPDDSGKEYELFDPQSEKVTDSLENKSLKIDALIPLPIGKEELLAIDEAREVGEKHGLKQLISAVEGGKDRFGLVWLRTDEGDQRLINFPNDTDEVVYKEHLIHENPAHPGSAMIQTSPIPSSCIDVSTIAKVTPPAYSECNLAELQKGDMCRFDWTDGSRDFCRIIRGSGDKIEWIEVGARDTGGGITWDSEMNLQLKRMFKIEVGGGVTDIRELVEEATGNTTQSS